MYLKLMNHNLFALSENIKSGYDFYNFVNENWINSNEIPDDRQRWDTFQELEKNTFEKIKKILEEPQNSDSNFYKTQILYSQFNDFNLRTSNENY